MEINRRSFMKLVGLSAASLSLGAALSACVNDNKGNLSAETHQVVVTMTPGSEPAAGFDPLVSWGCGEHVHEPLIQSTLITTDANLDFVNDLATEYFYDQEKQEWVFCIRTDVFFSDGHPLTAHDVAFTINGIIHGEAAEADLSSVSEAIADNDETVRLVMNRPNNAILYTLAVVGIVPAHAYDKNYGSNPIGSGRYILEQWDRGQQVILTANPNYYGEQPIMQRVVVLFMEEDASFAAAQAGQVDIAYTSATLSDALPQDFSLLICDSVDSRGISLPTIEPGGMKADGSVEYPAGNAVTSDVALRQAMNCGVDRQQMIDNVLNGMGSIAYSVGDGMPWSSDDMRIETDINRAKQILSNGGWSMGADGVLEKKGVQAAFDLYYSAGDSVRQALATDFANQMADLGIQVNVKGASWDDIYPNQYSSAVLWGWGSNSPVEMYQLLHSKGWGNYACYNNDVVDANLETAQAQPDIESSYAYYQKAQWDSEFQTGVAPQGASTWIWLVNVQHLYFQRDGLRVAKQKPHPHGHGWSLVNNVDQWSWE